MKPIILGDMDRRGFEDLVIKAIETLPEEFKNKLENVEVVIEDWPSPRQLRHLGLKYNTQLLGLYEGVPLTKRGRHYGMVPPDKITIFQKPIEAQCRSEREIAREVQRVARHEIAHYFGMDEASLKRIEDET